MNVALIQPNSPFLMNERVFPNIGLTRVATQLEKDGHNVKIYDFNGKKAKEIKSEIKSISSDYDYYGFSSTTPQFPYTMKILDNLKEFNPSARTIIGGPHVNALNYLKQQGIPDKNIDDLNKFDTIFVGEGEESSNIFNKGWQYGKMIKDIDTVQIPNRNFLDIASYKYSINGRPTTSIQTQRGCPHKCVFCCGRDIDIYKKVRMHSPERVVQELDQLNKEYGYDSFMWYDDEINIGIRRLEKLCNLLKDKPYQHRGFIRSDMIVKHPESVKWMKDAGFIKLCSGIESGSNRILEVLNKKSTYEINKKACELVKDSGIHFESFMILGHPSETMKDVNLTKKWLLDAKPDDFDINILTTYPGSKIYDEAIQSTKFKDYSWEWNGLYFNKPLYSKDDSYYKGLNRQSKSDTRTKTLSHVKLVTLRNIMEAEVRSTLYK